MAYNAAILSKARANIARRHEENLAEQERRTRSVYAREPRVRAIDAALRRQMAELSSSRPDSLKGRVLLVDDLVDSGLTLKKVVEHLQNNYPGVTEVRTAVLWWKGCSQVEPDYYVEYLGDNPWIHQPFEEYDTMRLGQLVAKVEGKRKPE